METINIEDIMKEIREDIKTRGYKKSDLKFADIEMDSPDAGSFNIGRFKASVHQSYQRRLVNSYRPLVSYTPVIGPIVKFVKKVMRKLLCFYVEPIVEDQNKFNDSVVDNMAQISTKFDNDQLVIEGLQARIEELEETCNRLEKQLKEKN